MYTNICKSKRLAKLQLITLTYIVKTARCRLKCSCGPKRVCIFRHIRTNRTKNYFIYRHSDSSENKRGQVTIHSDAGIAERLRCVQQIGNTSFCHEIKRTQIVGFCGYRSWEVELVKSLAAAGSNRAWQGDLWYFKTEVGCLAQMHRFFFVTVIRWFLFSFNTPEHSS